MSVRFLLMDSDELRRLIGTPASGNAFPEDTVKCVSIADVVLEIERIRKRGRATAILGVIKGCKCEFHEAASKGYVHTATLDRNAIQDALFETTDSFYDVDFWKPVVDRQTDPSYSVRLASFKSYDQTFGTGFHLEVLNLPSRKDD